MQKKREPKTRCESTTIDEKEGERSHDRNNHYSKCLTIDMDLGLHICCEKNKKIPTNRFSVH
jgi:hypothetical protein